MNKNTTTNKPKEFIISDAELSRLGMGVMAKALKVVNTTKNGKIIIRLGKQ